MSNSHRPSGRCAAWQSTNSPARRPASSARRRLHRRPRSACTADPPSRHPVQSRPIRASRDNRGLRLLSFSSSRFNWLEHHHRHLQFLRQRLDAAGNVGNFLLPVFLRSPRSRMQKLQIVNHKKLDAVLLVHPPRPRPQLQNRKPRRIVNEQLARPPAGPPRSSASENPPRS